MSERQWNPPDHLGADRMDPYLRRRLQMPPYPIARTGDATDDAVAAAVEVAACWETIARLNRDISNKDAAIIRLDGKLNEAQHAVHRLAQLEGGQKVLRTELEKCRMEKLALEQQCLGLHNTAEYQALSLSESTATHQAAQTKLASQLQQLTIRHQQDKSLWEQSKECMFRGDEQLKAEVTELKRHNEMQKRALSEQQDRMLDMEQKRGQEGLDYDQQKRRSDMLQRELDRAQLQARAQRDVLVKDLAQITCSYEKSEDGRSKAERLQKAALDKLELTEREKRQWADISSSKNEEVDRLRTTQGQWHNELIALKSENELLRGKLRYFVYALKLSPLLISSITRRAERETEEQKRQLDLRLRSQNSLLNQFYEEEKQLQTTLGESADDSLESGFRKMGIRQSGLHQTNELLDRLGTKAVKNSLLERTSLASRS
jgi:hypothetical protein